MAGRLVHFELPADEAQRAMTFYEQVFGWNFNRAQMEGAPEYYMLEGLDPGGAVYPSQEGERGPIVYFDTDDIDATIKKINDAGGKAEDKQPIPTIGWFARARDTEGNPISLFQSDESVQP